MKNEKRFSNWEYPQIEDGKPTQYNWVVQNKDGFSLGYKTDIGAFTYINAQYGVIIDWCLLRRGLIQKRNCKIGSHSVVMPGVTVGENSIVGACSFVNHDIPDNVVAVGIPAKVIKEIDK